MEQNDNYLKYSQLLINLISSYFNKKKLSLALEENDFKWLYRFGKSHKIGATLYFALSFNDAFKEEKIEKAFESFYASCLKKTILFEQERAKLYSFFNENGIDFLPLKGINFCTYYPEYGMREFADNDILFDKKYAKKVRNYFLKEGYKVETYGNGPHDVYQKAPSLNFEMHRFLFNPEAEFGPISDYFINILKASPIKEGHEHVMSNEDSYHYFIAHAYKHFSHGGCGVRTLIDIALYLERFPLNREELDKALQRSGLYEFEQSISSLSLKIFRGNELSKEEADMFLYIMYSGAYGTMEHHVLNNVTKQSKFGYIMHRLFPPLSYYKNCKPWAYYSIIGIPIAWFMRLVRALIHRGKNIKEEIRIVKESER